MDITQMSMEQLLEYGYITQEQYDQGFVTYNQVVDNVNAKYGDFFKQLGVPGPFHRINGDLIGWDNNFAIKTSPILKGGITHE